MHGKGLGQQGVGAREEAVLRPLLRRAVPEVQHDGDRDAHKVWAYVHMKKQFCVRFCGAPPPQVPHDGDRDAYKVWASRA